MFSSVTIMLNKNTLGVKKCKANKKQRYLYVTKSFDLRPRSYLSKMFQRHTIVLQHMYFHKDWLCHLALYFDESSNEKIIKRKVKGK